jgi:hypothetical protein
MIKSAWTWIQKKAFWGILRHWLSDQKYAEWRYRIEQQRALDLEDPERFTEKIQWIKLNERTDLRKRVADRLKARDYVSEKAGSEHLVPLINHFDTLTHDDWQSLPEQFVLKANHGCGMVHIVREKKSESFETVKEKTDSWQNTDYFFVGREWVYKNLPRPILAEALLTDDEGNIPIDYKIFCFHGEVKIIQIDFDRFGDQKRNLYDRDFNRLDGQLLYPNYEGTVDKPSQMDNAILLAEKLSEDFSFLRVDLYLTGDHIYVGELTNYPGNGFINFEPESMERWAGSLLTLQQSN